jgi:hypothetical protein
MLRIPLSATGPADAFALQVEAHRAALEVHRRGKPGIPAPRAPALVEAVIVCVPRPDPLPAAFEVAPYEIFDDGPTLDDRKAALRNVLHQAAAATRDAILSPARLEVLNLDFGEALNVPESQRTPAQQGAIDAYVAIDARRAEITRNAAHAAVEIEDLTADTVATWKVPEL